MAQTGSLFGQQCSLLGCGTLLEKEPSFQQVVDLGPHLGRIVVVWPIDLPPSAGLSLSLRGAPVNHGLMCLPQPRIWSPMHGHRHLPSWQGRRYHPSGERARYEQLDTNLDMWNIVPIQHDNAAASVDPACMQARPHLITQFPPQRRELLPRGRRRHHCCRASHDVCHGYLIAHFHTSHRYPVFLTKDAPTVSLQSIANPSNICPPSPVLHNVDESVC